MGVRFRSGLLAAAFVAAVAASGSACASFGSADSVDGASDAGGSADTDTDADTDADADADASGSAPCTVPLLDESFMSGLGRFGRVTTSSDASTIGGSNGELLATVQAASESSYAQVEASVNLPAGYTAVEVVFVVKDFKRDPDGWAQSTVGCTADFDPLNVAPWLYGDELNIAAYDYDSIDEERFVLSADASAMPTAFRMRLAFGSGTVTASLSVNGGAPVTLTSIPLASHEFIRLKCGIDQAKATDTGATSLTRAIESVVVLGCK